MLCRSCKKSVDSSMRHAITANLCPFCGNQIFTTNELALRKSISRVLIKNGLDNDETISKIVDDIMDLATGSETTSEQTTVSSQPQSKVDNNSKGEDGLTPAERNAPARVLSPAPRPLAQSSKEGGADPVAMAMRAFEEDNSDPMRSPYASDQAGGDDDVSGIFFMERGGGEDVEKKRQAAASARQAGLMGGGPKRTTPSFSRAQ